MTARKTRDPRTRVYVQARLRADEQWDDVTIQNVSRRGLMAYCAAPPRRGQYVELRRANQVIVGRVVWAAAGKFGVRAQDDIDLGKLTGTRPNPGYDGSDRRQFARPGNRRAGCPPLSCAAALERSRRISSLMDFSFVVLAGLGAAALLFGAVRDTLGQPMARASGAMAMSAGRTLG